MRSLTVDPRHDPVTRVPVRTRTAMRQVARRLDTHGPRAERAQAERDLVQTAHQVAEVAVLNERQRLARELHDSVAQTLFGITLSASRVLMLLERGETEQVRTIVSDVLRQANDSQTELRVLVRGLRSDESSHLARGLTDALASLAWELEATARCQVRLSLAVEPDIAPSTKATLYRIAREALHNITKHAQALHVDLELEVGPSEVTLSVTDDGRGFDPDATPPGHFGVQLMCEQALALGATLDVVTGPGRGTQVRVRMGRPL
jgi:signal transduction histidine kinase